MKFNYKVTLQYKGTKFNGWQVQKKEIPTIQGNIHSSLEKVLKSNTFKVLGASRTDAGVHALEQICRIDIPIKLEEHSLKNALNSFLDEDIRITSCKICSTKFNPIINAIKKDYGYFFLNDIIKNPFAKDYIYFHNMDIDFSLVNEACKYFIGKKDFLNYYTLGSDVSTTIREIFECKIEDKIISSPGYSYSCKMLFISGNGFLKQMVRLIMGTLFNVGIRKVSLDELANSLDGKHIDKKLGIVVPSQGLYLLKVHYID